MTCEHTDWYTEMIASYVQLRQLDSFRVAESEDVVVHVQLDLIELDLARSAFPNFSLADANPQKVEAGRQVVYNLLVSNAPGYH